MKTRTFKNGIKAVLIMLAIFAAANAGYAQEKWTKIEYSFNIGSLPPPYHYEYTITITSDGTAALEYMMGYTRTSDNTLEYTIDIRNTPFKYLKKEIKESGLLNKRIGYLHSGEIPVGGSSEHMTIFDGSDTITYVPSYPDKAYDKVLERLYLKIRKCIPDNVWNEVKTKRDERMDKLSQ